MKKLAYFISAATLALAGPALAAQQNLYTTATLPTKANVATKLTLENRGKAGNMVITQVSNEISGIKKDSVIAPGHSRVAHIVLSNKDTEILLTADLGNNKSCYLYLSHNKKSEPVIALLNSDSKTDKACGAFTFLASLNNAWQVIWSYPAIKAQK